ncbi:DUF58 domain-containing protein [Schleiferia thermophila]|jgi:uncharacterized protein (DUF58 family)|uniref:DUF58 domain-containing protein n=1 Tax=Schleiferia thermophila TaxID=884107 RepID=UPI0004E60CD6|nr:DUF58 domain-containing protein [Schleiferia thermophila]KFD39489.1 von Willebrand factor [Schleiferia thermophila str. Yellowstone]PMB34825.1 DUF58 domain-containing protein [Fischerella thermalis CCMEE 5319]
MEIAELLKKVRQIELKTRKKSNEVLLGSYHSAFKGRGLTVSEVRPYAFGDDVRLLDWKVTARLLIPHIKVMQEERELTLLLVVDRSGSNLFGTRYAQKADYITEIAALLAFSALNNNDKVGVLSIGTNGLHLIKPHKGRQHVLKIIRELIGMNGDNGTAHLFQSLDFINKAFKKRSIVFILSDFLIEENLEKSVKQLSTKHDLVAIRVQDNFEKHPIPLGFTKMKDIESGESYWVNLNKKKIEAYKKDIELLNNEIKNMFQKNGAGFIDLTVGDDYYKSLIKYFQSRR